jgi:hypothetical protein
MELKDIIQAAVTYSLSLSNDHDSSLNGGFHESVALPVVLSYGNDILNQCNGCECGKLDLKGYYARDENGELILRNNNHARDYIQIDPSKLEHQQYMKNVSRFIFPYTDRVSSVLGIDEEDARKVWIHTLRILNPVYQYFYKNGLTNDDPAVITEQICRENGKYFEAVLLH